VTSGFALAFERAMDAMPKRRALAMVMTGCLLVGASYALFNTQTHAVGAVAAVGVEDSKVVDLVYAMEDMERGLQEMAQSVEHMQEMLKRSPMVQALAQRKPEVKQILNDPKKLQEEMALVQRNLAALQKAEQAMRNPYKRQQVMRWADIMLQKVAAVVQDLQDEKEGRRLSEQILPQAEAFQAPAMKAPAMRGQVAARSGPATMFSEGDIGILPPLGVWDPLGYIDSRDMRRYEEMEIKHGRAAMFGFTHVIVTEAGLRFPGYLSDGTFGGAPIKFADVPAGAINTVLAIPGSSWAQIICLCGVLEAGVFKQEPDREAGDIAPEWGPWVRYDDPEAKTFKLNVERQNGRAAMLGITGIILHELLGVDGLYPTGGLASGAAPPTIF